jgi:uncharacterized membrane protein
MTFRYVLMTAHVFVAIVSIGWLAMNSMIVPGAIRKGQAGFVAYAAGMSKKIGPTSTIVFLLGIWLVLRDKKDGIDFSDGWVSAAMVLFIITAVIGAVFIGRAEHAAAEKLAAGENADAEARTIAILGGISTLLLLAIVYLMVRKPGYYP